MIKIRMSDSQSSNDKYLDMNLTIDNNDEAQIKKYLFQYNHFRRINIWLNNEKSTISSITCLCNSQISPQLCSFKCQTQRMQLHSFQNLIIFLSDRCRFLTTISFKFSHLADQCINYIVQAKWLFLTSVNLGWNKITACGVQSMGKCKWKYLRQIDLSNNPIKNSGVKQLVKHSWSKLRRLRLDDTSLTKDGVRTLVRGHWPKLKKLSLQQNCLNNEGLSGYFLLSNWSKKISVILDDLSFYFYTECQFQNLVIRELYYKQQKIQSMKPNQPRQIGQVKKEQQN